MLTRPEQRVAVFIDTQNMYHSAKHLYGARVNFAGLVELAVSDRRVVRAIAYVAKSKTGEEQAFFEALLQNGIELKIKDVQEFASGAKKADWDVGMAVDAISISSHVDAVILVTGDGDFVPVVEYLRTHGVRCEVVAFAPSTNNRLREVGDSFTDLTEHLEHILIRSRGLRRPIGKTAPETVSTTTTEPEHLRLDAGPGSGSNSAQIVPPLRRKNDSDGEDGSARKVRVTF